MEKSDQWEMSHGELVTAPGPGCRVRHKSPEQRTGHADRVLTLGPLSFRAAEGGEHSDNSAPRPISMTPDDPEARTTADILLTIGKVDEDAAESSSSDREHVGDDEHADGTGSDAVSSGALGAKRPSVVESLTLEDVQRYFSIPLKDAAVRLGIRYALCGVLLRPQLSVSHILTIVLALRHIQHEQPETSVPEARHLQMAVSTGQTTRVHAPQCVETAVSDMDDMTDSSAFRV